MKNKVEGFTIIELIVVIAIIGVLAMILVPTIIGYIVDARVSKCNANAKMVLTASQIGIVELVREGGDPVANAVYLKSAAGNEAVCSGKPSIKVNLYLGDDFKGYFGFKIDSSGTDVSYAVWSDQPLAASDVVQLTESQVEASVYTSKPIGCYPLK